MKITPQYMERFAVPIADDPRQVLLSGWEIDATVSITIDDPDGHSLAINHWDEWSSETQWEIQEGTAKRWTFVTVTKDGEIVGDHGFEFPGLVKIDDLRAWYRGKLGLVEVARVEAEAAE